MLDLGITEPPAGDPLAGTVRPDWRDSLDPAWSDALLAARLFACAPAALGGIHVIARAGPVRDRWLDALRRGLAPDVPVTRITPNVAPGRLTGGIDVAATLARGAPVHEAGLLQTTAGGCLIIAMAERLAASLAGIIARAGAAGPDGAEASPFGIVALDESEDDDDHALPGAIADRLGLRIRLDGIAVRRAVLDIARPRSAPDPAAVAEVAVGDDLITAIIAGTATLRGNSMRAPSQALCVTRLLAALEGRDHANDDDVVTALRLTCGAALAAPEDEAHEHEPADPAPPDDGPRGDDAAASEPPPAGEGDAPSQPAEMPDEIAVEAAQIARLELRLLKEAGMTRTRAQAPAGKAGALRRGAARGRPAGLVARPPYPGARPNVVATLRTAAPWQTIRRAARGLPPWRPGEPLAVRPDDFRYVRYAHNTEATAIFAVDASGSTALERLGEAKGCVEMLLAECYVRRDQVALIAFRGTGAEILLEPTRSLVRAKRALTALPGGGPTPLAAGLHSAAALAGRVRRRGQSPLIIVLTDGNGNIARDGTPDRAAARADAEAAALEARETGARSVIIDIARRPRPGAQSLAGTMGADYVTLPRADARAMSDLVSSYLKAS